MASSNPSTNATQVVQSAKDIIPLSSISGVVINGIPLGATAAQVFKWSSLSLVEKRALVIEMMQAYHARIAEAKRIAEEEARIAAELEAKIQADRDAILQEGKAKAEEEARIAAEKKRIAAEEAEFEFECMSPEEQKAVLAKEAEAVELAKALKAVKEQEAVDERRALKQVITSITAAEEASQLVLDTTTAALPLEKVEAAMRAALAEQDFARDKAAKETAAIVAAEKAAKEAAEEALLAAAMAKAALEQAAENAARLVIRGPHLEQHLSLTSVENFITNMLVAAEAVGTAKAMAEAQHLAQVMAKFEALPVSSAMALLKKAAGAELECLKSNRPGALELEKATKACLKEYKKALDVNRLSKSYQEAQRFFRTRETIGTHMQKLFVNVYADISGSMCYITCVDTNCTFCKSKAVRDTYATCLVRNAVTIKGQFMIFTLGPDSGEREAKLSFTDFAAFHNHFLSKYPSGTTLGGMIDQIRDPKNKQFYDKPFAQVVYTDGAICKGKYGSAKEQINELMRALKEMGYINNLKLIKFVFTPNTAQRDIDAILAQYGEIFKDGNAIEFHAKDRLSFYEPKGLENAINAVFVDEKNVPIKYPAANPLFPVSLYGFLFLSADATPQKVAPGLFHPDGFYPGYEEIFNYIMENLKTTYLVNPEALFADEHSNVGFLHQLLRMSPLRTKYNNMLGEIVKTFKQTGKNPKVVGLIEQMIREAETKKVDEVAESVKALNPTGFLRFPIDQLPTGDDVRKALKDGSFQQMGPLVENLFSQERPPMVVALRDNEEEEVEEDTDPNFASLPLLSPEATAKECRKALSHIFYGSSLGKVPIDGLPLIMFLTFLLTTPKAHLSREFVEMGLKVLFDNEIGILSQVGIDVETETDETFNPMPKGDKASNFFSPFVMPRVISLFKNFGGRFEGLSLVMKGKLFGFFEYIDDAYHKVKSMFSVLYEPKVEGVSLTPKSVSFEQVCTFKHDAELRVGSIVGIQFPSDKDPYPNNATVGLVLSIFEKDGELCVQVLELDQPNYQHTSKKGKVAFDTIAVRAENLTVLTKDPVFLPKKFTLDGKEVNTFSYKDGQVVINPAVCNSLPQGHVISSLNRYLMDKQASQATDSNGQLLYGLRALFNEDGSRKRDGCTFKKELLDAQNTVVAEIVSAFESANPRVDFVKTVQHQFDLSKFTEMFGNTLGLHPLIVDHLRNGHTFINRDVITRLMEAGMHQVYSPDAKSFKGITFAFFGESRVSCDFSRFYKELFAEVCAKNQVRQSFTPFTLLTEMVCGVCCDKHPIAEFTQAPCGHVFCTESQRNATEAHPLLTGHLNTVVYRCFVEGCQRPIPSGNAAFDEFHLTLPIGAKATLCACGDFFQNEARVCGLSGAAAPLETECPKCLTAKAKPDGCTPCSQCGVFAIRNGGCQHMTCSQCNAYTCFGCGAPLSRDFPIGWWNCKAHSLGGSCLNRKSNPPTCIEHNRCEDCKALCGNVP